MFWRSEFRNVLALYIRKKRLTLPETLEIMQQATRLLENYEYAVSSNLVLQLVATSTCSAYDCEFVALAKELDVPLITTDKQILTQFPAQAQSLAHFIVASE